MPKRLTYSEIIKIFLDRGCSLLTTEKEYDEIVKTKIPTSFAYTFVASCGHENVAVLRAFIHQDCGLICKDCMKKRIQKCNNCDDRQANIYHEQEAECFNALRDILCKDFEVRKTDKGCPADFIIRPKSIDDDAWLGCQLKTTRKCKGGYNFRLNRNKYENMVMLFRCVDDSSLWVIPFEEMYGAIVGVYIGTTEKSKYFKYKVDENVLPQIMMQHFSAMKLDTSKNFMVPKSPKQQPEYKYRKIREEYCDFLKFELPDVENSRHDFTVNEKRIQEKVTGKNHGMVNGYNISMKRQGKHYKKGMNDFYWFHIPDIFLFYVIPEKDLIEQKIVDSGEEAKLKSCICFNLKKVDWHTKYQFDYKNLDKEKLIALINTGTV